MPRVDIVIISECKFLIQDDLSNIISCCVSCVPNDFCSSPPIVRPSPLGILNFTLNPMEDLNFCDGFECRHVRHQRMLWRSCAC